ncbi:MAG: aminotransferase class III-fold pyridoxal phosphate-dependent enzyme [Deltaproteobacteria bacterium]|nr:aminotransferase class III-fold pyridoxal phosphate-dependent enzyme [Deltaproteobacteria bacterium]
MRLLSVDDCSAMDAQQTRELYRRFVNPGQVDLLSSFGFGQTLAVRAEGMYIDTQDGRRILDFTGGIGVLGHGHNHPRILAARRAYQEQHRMEVHKSFLCPYVAGLSKNIAALLPADLDVSFFAASGAEAVEGALKLAYKAHGGRRRHVLHADISYHGKLIGAGSITGSLEVPFRFQGLEHTASFRYGDMRSVEDAVRAHRTSSGECDIYALIVEPMSVSTLTKCSNEHLRALRALADREGIALIFDEVMSGWGWTGELFHFQKSGVVPDVLTMSKTFGGGKSSISAYTARTPWFERAYGDLKDALLHGSTYNAFGEECATAIEAIRVIVDDGYPARAKQIGQRLHAGLDKIAASHRDVVREVRGEGCYQGVVLDTSLPRLVEVGLEALEARILGDPRVLPKIVNAAVVSRLYDQHGVLVYFLQNRDMPLMFCPSMIVTDEEIDRFLAAFDETVGRGRVRLVSEFVAEKLRRG